MHHEDIIRAWKDEAFRASLAPDQQKLLPDHPAGMVELADEDLIHAAGGAISFTFGYDCIVLSIVTVLSVTAISVVICEPE